MAKVEYPRFTDREMVYNPLVDLHEVDQFGFLDLNDAYTKGIIPPSVDITDEFFNGVQNPGTLISRSMDIFDGLRKAEYVRSQLDKLSAEDREKVERQMNAQSTIVSTSTEA